MPDDTKFQTLQQSMSDVHITEEKADQVIVGLDFGTTFSGIAYAFSVSDRPDIQSITDWPGLEGHIQPKVPSVISYDPKNKNSYTWGAQKHVHPQIAGMKLLLDPDQDKPLYVPPSNTKAELKRLAKPVKDVAADYVGCIYRHAMNKIESKVPKDYLERCQRKFVITVPAVWSDKAKDATLKAAKQAGIHPVSLITEPEAAALYTLHMMQDRALDIGDAFVICDAGGGTVDLISYEITALIPRLELKGLVPNDGGMAGSLVLNRRFEDALKDMIGDEDFFQLKKKPGFHRAMEYFDRHVKTAFRSNEDEEYPINFPMVKLNDIPESRLESNCWMMKGEDLKRLFKPLTTDIEKLVQEQVTKIRMKRIKDNHAKGQEIKAIFLVGGFGSSEHLKNCISNSNPDIQVIQPVDAWSAIVKGAVLSQLPQQAFVSSSLANRHYGVCAREKFNETKDKGQPKIWSAADGFNRVSKVTWYIYKDEDLERDKKIMFPFYKELKKGYRSDDLIIKSSVTASDALYPPTYPDSDTTRTYCTATADLRELKTSDLRKKTGADGNTYYDLCYDLSMTPCSAGFIFAIEIDGAVKGSVDVKFE